MKLKKKKDKYSKARGGTSQFLNIHCGVCGHFLIVYQKDGPGVLQRLYVDRISVSPYMEPRTEKFKKISEMPQLVCPNKDCMQPIGAPMLYSKNGERRFAYRIIGAIKKIKNPKGEYSD